MRLGVYGDIVLDVVVFHREAVARDSDARARIVPSGGGSAANVAVWAARRARETGSGLEVAFFGQAGDDPAGRALKADLAAEGVAVDPPAGNLHLTPDSATGMIVVNVEGEARTMVTDRGANLTVGPDLVPAEALAGCAWLHLTGYSFFEPGPRAAALAALERCRRLGKPFSLDPSSYRLLEDYGPARFLDEIEGATVLFPNRDEAATLTGLGDPAEAAAALARRFPVVVVKLGPGGCLVAAAALAAAVRAAPPPGPVVDPTGAGDAFAAGFITEYLGSRRGKGSRSLIAAAEGGVRLAAQAVTVAGGRGQGFPVGPAGPGPFSGARFRRSNLR